MIAVAEVPRRRHRQPVLDSIPITGLAILRKCAEYADATAMGLWVRRGEGARRDPLSFHGDFPGMPIGITRMLTGLNNQRMCLLGLFSIARERGTSAVLPETAVDYAPRVVARHRDILLGKLFDLPTLVSAIPPDLLSGEPPGELISFRDCFAACVRPLESESRDSLAASVMLGTVATRRIADRATELGEWLLARGAVPLQLRIERDWQAYLRHKWGEDSQPVRDADPDTILARLRRTPSLADVRTLWACCDDEDLLQTTGELKEIARRHRFELLFKTDLPTEVRQPKRVILRAMMDFTMCRNAPRYIGLQGSTFSRMLARENAWLGRPREVQYFDRDVDVAMPV